MAATGDRVPTVFIDNRGVGALDPVRVGYGQPIRRTSSRFCSYFTIANSSASVHGFVRPATRARVFLTTTGSTAPPAWPHSRRM